MDRKSWSNWIVSREDLLPPVRKRGAYDLLYVDIKCPYCGDLEDHDTLASVSKSKHITCIRHLWYHPACLTAHVKQTGCDPFAASGGGNSSGACPVDVSTDDTEQTQDVVSQGDANQTLSSDAAATNEEKVHATRAAAITPADRKYVRVADVHKVCQQRYSLLEEEHHVLGEKYKALETQLNEKDTAKVKQLNEKHATEMKQLNEKHATELHRLSIDHGAVVAHMQKTVSALQTASKSTPEVMLPNGSDVTRLIQRLRSTRAKAPTGIAYDAALVLASAPSIYPGVNQFQSDCLLAGFLAKPKHTLTKTLMSLHPTARERELICPIVKGLAQTIDDVYAGHNFDRSVVVHTGTQRQIHLAQFMAELRLLHPEVHEPSSAQREASWLFQYVELYETFKDRQYVTPTDITTFFRGLSFTPASIGPSQSRRRLRPRPPLARPGSRPSAPLHRRGRAPWSTTTSTSRP
eukprot:7390038-Prymnesium_polylepis.4